MDDAAREALALGERQVEFLERWARAGEAERLRDFALGLLDRSRTDDRVALVWHVARLLALTPGLDFALALRDLARELDPRELAGRASAGQPLEVCAELVASAEPADDRFVACLVQELVLRHGSLEREPFASSWRGLASRGHELAWLPLRLSRVEAAPELPSFSPHGEVRARLGPLDEGAGPDAGPAVGRIGAEATTPADAERILAAVAGWKAEARVFGLTGGAEQPLAVALGEAGLECLPSGLLGRRRAPSRGRQIRAADAWAAVFDLASGGGAYDDGEGGAYGRLHAWRSLGALAGATPDAPFDEVVDTVERASWYRFESDAGWFWNELYDLGLGAVSPDGRRLAVLAATDTD
ncbi:MAG TPA: DUF6183 family protein [Gaiellaceae bacterium]|nr:DUF6183 family protein [Gaiellaceae bacterium]